MDGTDADIPFDQGAQIWHSWSQLWNSLQKGKPIRTCIHYMMHLNMKSVHYTTSS